MVNNSSGTNTSGNLFQTTLANATSIAADSTGQLIPGSGSGSSVIFLANAPNTQTLAASGAAIITFNSVIINVGSAFSSNTFTAPSNGTYFFSLCIAANQATAGDSVTFNFSSGATATCTNFNTAVSFQYSSSFIIQMTASDTVNIVYNNNNGTDATVVSLGGDFKSWFMGYKIA